MLNHATDKAKATNTAATGALSKAVSEAMKKVSVATGSSASALAATTVPSSSSEASSSSSEDTSSDEESALQKVTHTVRDAIASAPVSSSSEEEEEIGKDGNEQENNVVKIKKAPRAGLQSVGKQVGKPASSGAKKAVTLDSAVVSSSSEESSQDGGPHSHVRPAKKAVRDTASAIKEAAASSSSSSESESSEDVVDQAAAAATVSQLTSDVGKKAALSSPKAKAASSSEESDDSGSKQLHMSKTAAAIPMYVKAGSNIVNGAVKGTAAKIPTAKKVSSSSSDAQSDSSSSSSSSSGSEGAASAIIPDAAPVLSKTVAGAVTNLVKAVPSAVSVGVNGGGTSKAVGSKRRVDKRSNGKISKSVGHSGTENASSGSSSGDEQKTNKKRQKTNLTDTRTTVQIPASEAGTIQVFQDTIPVMATSTSGTGQRNRLPNPANGFINRERQRTVANVPFRRVKVEEHVIDERLKDNSFVGKKGAHQNDFGWKASKDLIVTRGDSFSKPAS